MLYFKKLSLRYRVFFASILTLFVFFSLAGFGLQRAYNDSLDNAVEGELRAYMLSLLGEIDIDLAGQLQLYDLSVAAFNQPNSGIYAEIWNQQKLLWRSESLIAQPLPRVGSMLGEYQLFSGITSESIAVQNKKINLLSLLVDWDEGDIKQQFSIVVANDAQPYIDRQKAYKSSLLLWLIGLGAGLIILQILLFKWLFNPINQVTHELRNIKKGQQADFLGTYPQEVSMLTRSLNQFLMAERHQIQRIKDSLANLAHSLKTPLAAMRMELSELDKEPSDKKFNKLLFEQQVDRIATVVDYQLNRTSASMRPNYRQAQQCYECINRLIVVMRRLQQSKNVIIDSQVSENIVFFGDVDDLMEVIGNVLENACKWAETRVTIKCVNHTNNKLNIVIVDDGPGVPADQMGDILIRGKRLDTNTEGQGIGLAMVSDLIDSYAGSLRFAEAIEYEKGFSSGLAVVIII